MSGLEEIQEDPEHAPVLLTGSRHIHASFVQGENSEFPQPQGFTSGKFPL